MLVASHTYTMTGYWHTFGHSFANSRCSAPSMCWVLIEAALLYVNAVRRISILLFFPQNVCFMFSWLSPSYACYAPKKSNYATFTQQRPDFATFMLSRKQPNYREIIARMMDVRRYKINLRSDATLYFPRSPSMFAALARAGWKTEYPSHSCVWRVSGTNPAPHVSC